MAVKNVVDVLGNGSMKQFVDHTLLYRYACSVQFTLGVIVRSSFQTDDAFLVAKHYE